MDREEHLTHFINTTGELFRMISSLGQKQLNMIPFAGSWTAAQVGDHLLKSYDGIVKTLHGKAIATDRPIDEKSQGIRELFLNFDIKFESPDFIIPSNGLIHKEKLVSDLEEKIQAVITFAESNDLSLTCLDFELPGSGALTRLEWIQFMTVHTQRHNHQLKNIIHQLDEKFQKTIAS